MKIIRNIFGQIFRNRSIQPMPKAEAPAYFSSNSIRQVDVEPQQLKGLDTVKPNRYGNYAITPTITYTVYGINPKTNRRNKKQYEALDEDDVVKKAEKDGLMAPFEISFIGPADLPPTERQLEYAKDAGIQVPNGACKWDVSALLDRVERYDYEPATKEGLAYLAARRWTGSALIGYKAMINAMHYAGDQRDHLAMYAYCIYQAEHRLPFVSPDTDPRKDQYYAFADYALQHPKILEHFKRWHDDRTWSTTRAWAIYKDYEEFCGGKI